jgi:hypothetical protein
MLSIGPPSYFKYLIEEDFADKASRADTPETIILRLRDKKHGGQENFAAHWM